MTIKGKAHVAGIFSGSRRPIECLLLAALKSPVGLAPRGPLTGVLPTKSARVELFSP
jgi:hypothetical protein